MGITYHIDVIRGQTGGKGYWLSARDVVTPEDWEEARKVLKKEDDNFEDFLVWAKKNKTEVQKRHITDNPKNPMNPINKFNDRPVASSKKEQDKKGGLKKL